MSYWQNLSYLVIRLKPWISNWLHSKKDRLHSVPRSAILLFKLSKLTISSKAKTILSSNTKSKCNNLSKKSHLCKIELITKDIKRCKKSKNANNKSKNWSKSFTVHHLKIGESLYMEPIGILLHTATDICHLEQKILFCLNLKMKRSLNFSPISLNKWTRKILNFDHKSLNWPKRFTL